MILFSGYGHIYPITLMGQIFTIFYALVALGVFLLILANISTAFANGLTFIYSRLCCRCFRSARLKSEIPSRKLQRKLRRRLADEEVGEEVFYNLNAIIHFVFHFCALLLVIDRNFSFGGSFGRNYRYRPSFGLSRNQKKSFGRDFFIIAAMV